MVPGRLENPVHRLRDLVYGDNDYDVSGQEKGAYFGRCLSLKKVDSLQVK